VDGVREIGEATRRAIAAVSPQDGKQLTNWILLGDPELDVGPQATPRAPARSGGGNAAGTLRVTSVSPFRGETEVRFELALPARAALSIHDVRGRRVWATGLGDLAAGAHSARWDGRDRNGVRVAAGIYFLRIGTVDGSATAKVTLFR
jgi:hypothetical protein